LIPSLKDRNDPRVLVVLVKPLPIPDTPLCGTFFLIVATIWVFRIAGAALAGSGQEVSRERIE
jgi:hypothetical protein